MLALNNTAIKLLFLTEQNLYIPDLTAIVWSNLDYLGWIHPSGTLGYVAFESPVDGRLRGVKLTRTRRSESVRVRMEMCSWCHYVHRAQGTAFFMIEVKGSDGRRKLGNPICKDLDCSYRVRGPWSSTSLMSEDLYQPARIWRMKLAMHRWLGKANQI